MTTAAPIRLPSLWRGPAPRIRKLHFQATCPLASGNPGTGLNLHHNGNDDRHRRRNSLSDGSVPPSRTRSSPRSSGCSTASLASISIPDTLASRFLSSATTCRIPRLAATCRTSLRPRRTPRLLLISRRSMRPATRTTGADIGLKERLAACRKKVICSSDTPASTLSARRCWATSTTAIFAKGRTSASTASHPSTSSTRGCSWASPPWSDVRWGRRNRGSRACSSTRFTSSMLDCNPFRGDLPFGNAAGPVMATLLFRAGGMNLECHRRSQADLKYYELETQLPETSVRRRTRGRRSSFCFCRGPPPPKADRSTFPAKMG